MHTVLYFDFQSFAQCWRGTVCMVGPRAYQDLYANNRDCLYWFVAIVLVRMHMKGGWKNGRMDGGVAEWTAIPVFSPSPAVLVRFWRSWTRFCLTFSRQWLYLVTAFDEISSIERSEEQRFVTSLIQQETYWLDVFASDKEVVVFETGNLRISKNL